MKKTMTSSAASRLAALAVLGSLGSTMMMAPTPAMPSGQAEARTQSHASATGTVDKSAARDTASARLGTGYVRRHRAPAGKRYSASVRQHQRNARKARNVRRARAGR